MKDWTAKILLGLILGMLLMVPWAVSGPIQQQVGVNDWDFLNNRWVPPCNALGTGDTIRFPGDPGGPIFETPVAECGTNETQAMGYALNSLLADPAWERIRTATSDGMAATGLQAAGLMGWNGTTWDRTGRTASSDQLTGAGILAAGTMTFNQVTGTWYRAQAAGDNITSGGAVGTAAIPAVNAVLFDGTNYDVSRGASATNLTATTSTGIPFNVPLSTWSVTNTPAVATQATASRAAGAAGVRHVATTVTVCLAAGATAQTPILVNLRDGATGAGTVLRSWAISAPVNDSKCADLSGLAMIGTAATAMTIEFAAAGVASSQQTVTLTGFSVN